MEEKLQQVQEYFADPIFEDMIDRILEDYLDKTKCEFTHYQKNVFPICAAYYAIVETREIEAEQRRKQPTPTPAHNKGITQVVDNKSSTNTTINNKEQQIEEETQQSSSSCASPSDAHQAQPQNDSEHKKKISNVSIMELRNQFYKKVPIDQLLKTITEFSHVLQGRPFSETIQSKLESIKRNHSLFTKFFNVLECFYSDSEIIYKQLNQRVIWRLYLLLKEQLHKEHMEEDIEKCAYLLHFVCTEALVNSGKNPQCILSTPQQPTPAILPNATQPISINQISSMETISEQVNAILLKGKLEQAKMKEFKAEFTSILKALSQKIFYNEVSSNTNKSKNGNQTNGTDAPSSLLSTTNANADTKEKNSSADNLIEEENEGNQEVLQLKEDAQNQITNSFSSHSSLERLSKLLETEINSHPIMEEHEFLQKEEDLKKSLTTPQAKPISSMLLEQGPPGVTRDYQESKYQNNHHNPGASLIPQKTLNFNDDTVGLSLNSKLSDIERPMPSPLYNMVQHTHQQGEQFGLFQQPINHKTPFENQNFKMPNTRNAQIQSIAPSTPFSTALDNCKWINVYSKSDPTKRIDDLMNKINKEYKQKIIDEVCNIAREVFYNSKKKNEGLTNSDNAIESKVAKTSSFFQNVLEKMICDEEQRNCREAVLIQLLENRNFIFSLLANCVMTMCYVRDIKGISLELILKQCKITSLDFWRVISNFAKFDKFMPDVIKEQLFNQEKLILLYNIWEEKDHLMQNALKSFAEDNGKNQNYEKVICRRLISHSATRVKEICKVIELSDEIQERVWEALLYVYRAQIQLMNGRYVDQIIICSIYALKLIKSDLFKDKEIKFKGMISVCESLLHFNAEKVKKTFNDNGESIDIINFYNKIFLNPMKQYFKPTNNLASEGPAASVFHANNVNSTILNSSLRCSIPQNFINYTPLLKEEMQMNRMSMTPMTPVTQRLQAVENLESPYPINPNLKYIKEKIALNNMNRLSQQQQQQQQSKQGSQIQFISNQISAIINQQPKQDTNNNNNNINNTNNTTTKTITVLGSNFSQSLNKNPIGNQEKISSRKLNFEGEEKNSQGQSMNFFGNVNNGVVVVSTPTLEQKNSSPLDVSPKFGCANSASSFGMSQNKKFLEDSIDEQNASTNQAISDNNNNSLNLRTIKRQNSIFGVKNPNFNSDEENLSNKKTNKTNSNEINSKTSNSNDEH